MHSNLNNIEESVESHTDRGKLTLIEVIGSVEPLLSTIKIRKLAHFGHTIRHEYLHKVIMQCFVERKRRQGRPLMNWMFNII